MNIKDKITSLIGKKVLIHGPAKTGGGISIYPRLSPNQYYDTITLVGSDCFEVITTTVHGTKTNPRTYAIGYVMSIEE